MVLALMVMHLGVALVNYNALVHLAPVTDPAVGGTVGGESRAPERDIEPVHVGLPGARLDHGTDAPDPIPDPERWLRRRALLLGLLVVVELVLGIVVLALVPTGRPSGWLPVEGRAVYLIHALVGVSLTIGAVTLVLRVRGTSRIGALCGWIGLVGVVLAGIGGIATVAHPVRIVGLGLMLVGTVGAEFGYVLPALDSLSDELAPSRR